MKAYKKNVRIEKTGSFKKAYYKMDDYELYCGTSMKSYTDLEIKIKLLQLFQNIYLFN